MKNTAEGSAPINVISFVAKQGMEKNEKRGKKKKGGMLAGAEHSHLTHTHTHTHALK